jgi:hypothetical protein
MLLNASMSLECIGKSKFWLRRKSRWFMINTDWIQWQLSLRSKWSDSLNKPEQLIQQAFKIMLKE